ncbi:MAG: hypothetical protein ABS942_11170 [Solibacillus sp.]
MSYPNDIDTFTDKLNKRDKAYVIEEEVTVSNGVYESLLDHDNIVDSSVSVWTGSKLTGDKVANFILSIPSATPWKRSIKIFSSISPVFITYETFGDQVEADDINQLQSSMTATQTEVDRYKAANDLVVTNTVNRVTTLESKKADKTYVDTELLKKADKATTYTKSETDARIQAVVDVAPEALDTLNEIAAALNDDPNFAGTMTTELSKKVDKVVGKQLSTEDYSTAEKAKLANVEANANKYIHPSTHPATMIVEDSARRFATDAEKANWNGKLDATANAVSASKLATGRTIALSGDVTGGVVFDGSSNITITATVVDDSHNHVISNVDGLQVALDSKETPSGAQSKVDVHSSDAVKHITAAERSAWNAKSNLALGETVSTAYRGDRGKVAYDHSQVAHAPSNAQKNSDITKAEIEAKLTGNVSSHTHSQYVTQTDLGNAGYGDMQKSIYDTNGNGTVDAAESVPWSGVTGKPTTMPANGGNADTVDGKHASAFAPSGYGLGVALSQVIINDSNLAVVTGMYYASQSDTNKPSGVTDGSIFVMAYSELWINQLYLDWRTDKTYRRSKNNGAWTAWKELITKGNALTWNDLKGV